MRPPPRALQHRHSVADGLSSVPPSSPYPPPLSRSATYAPRLTAPPSPAPPFLHHNSEGTHPYAQAGPSAGLAAPSSYDPRPQSGRIPLQEAVALDRERTIRAQQAAVGSGRANGGPRSLADSSSACGPSSSPRGEGGTKKLYRRRTSAPGSASVPASPYPPVPPRPHPQAVPPFHYASYSPGSYYPDRRPPPSTYPPASPHQPTSLPSSPISPHTPAYPAYPSSASSPHLPHIPSLRTPEQVEAEQFDRIRRESLESEQARLAAVRSSTNQLLSTLDSSALEQAELDRLQAEEEERLLREALERSRIEEEERAREERRRRLEEEKEVQRAIQASRMDKGKERAPVAEVEDEVSRREREALELAMQLSLEETGRQLRYGGGRETSAQAFERYSISPTSTAPPVHSSAHIGLVAADSDPDDLPPAYEYPAYAPELDLPSDVILGPGRPLTIQPYAGTSASEDVDFVPTASRGPPPIPPVEVSSAAHSAYSPHLATSRHDSTSSIGYDSLAATAGSFSDTSGSVLRVDEPAAGGSGDDPFDDRFAASDEEGDDAHSAYSSVAVSEAPSAPSSQEGAMKDLFAAALARRETIRASMGPELHLAAAVQDADYDRGDALSLLPPPTSTSELWGAQQITPTAVTALPLPSPPVPPASAPTTPSLAQPLLTPPLSVGTHTSAPASPAKSFRSDPSFGGFVEDATSPAAFADGHILRDVRWGFVDEVQSRSGRYPSLEHEGDFPRGAQLSLGMEEDGRQPYRAFAVEARTWQGLLVYLMWHGNSRLEAAPADLQGDKSGRGLRVAIAVDFFRSPASNPSSSAVSIRPPRVRVRITLQPPSQDLANRRDTAYVTPVAPASLEPVNPSIRLALDMQPYLPLPLSALATILSHVHTQSRQALRSSLVSSSSSGAGAVLARAVDLFRRLNGETVTNDYSAESAADEDDEYGLLDRMKARLRRRRGPRVLHSDDGRGPARRPTGGPLPEGALLITPFSIEAP